MANFESIYNAAPTSEPQANSGQSNEPTFDAGGDEFSAGEIRRQIAVVPGLNPEIFNPFPRMPDILNGNDENPEDDEPIIDKQGEQILGSRFADREEFERQQQGVTRVLSYFMEMTLVDNIKEVHIDEKGKKTEIMPVAESIATDEETTEVVAEGDAADESAEDNKKDKKPKEPQKAREYTNQAEFYKANFGKPVELNGGGAKKLFMFLIACVATGLFFAVEANSYYVAKLNLGETANLTPMSCAFMWLTVFDTLKISLSPINGAVMGTAFLLGAGILGIIGLFVYLDSENRKLSRVGHEHGNARLGTPKDFKAFKQKFMDATDNNMLFGVFKGEQLGLSLNNKKVNRSANVLVIGGTGTGKTFKYIKPNILQENCSMIVTDPSGDIFRSFAPYLLSKGYNVYLFNASDFTFSNYYNPLLNVYNSAGEIDETQVDILVDLYMKNAKAGKEASGGDPFWDKSEKAFMTALIYYTLEEDDKFIREGFKCEGIEGGRAQAMEGGKCFSTILKLVQEAKVSDDDDNTPSTLTSRLNNFFARKSNNKTHLYYDTFLIAPQKTANTILITTAVDLQLFSTKEVDLITRENKDYPEMNIDINKMATQQSYLFLGIPQSHQAYNFLIAMLYSQLYGRLYELGERKLRGKFHIGYTVGTPVFEYFDSEEEARDFYENITYDKEKLEEYIQELNEINEKKKHEKIDNKSEPKPEPQTDQKAEQLDKDAKSQNEESNKADQKEEQLDKTVEPQNEESNKADQNEESNKAGNEEEKPKGGIIQTDYINGMKMYKIVYKGKELKTSIRPEPLMKYIDDLDKMYIWNGDDFAGGDPSLPIHINFLLDEFKNIGEIPNFLTILSTSRKYRIGSHVVIQDIGQLKTMYKEGEHETVMANVDTTIFLGSILKEDKEEIQKMLGKTTIRQKSTSSSNSGLSTSYTPTEVDLMSIDQISAINQDGRDDELVIIRDVTPYLCRKLNLTEHKRWGDVKTLGKQYGINLEHYYRNNAKNKSHEMLKND